MRLTTVQISQIRLGTARFFGSDSRAGCLGPVWMIISGVAIDLYIEPEIQDPAVLMEAKLRFLLDLHRTLGDQKIDVVLRRSTARKDIPVFRIARETGARLL